jgi:hypothetical protein
MEAGPRDPQSRRNVPNPPEGIDGGAGADGTDGTDGTPVDGDVPDPGGAPGPDPFAVHGLTRVGPGQDAGPGGAGLRSEGPSSERPIDEALSPDGPGPSSDAGALSPDGPGLSSDVPGLIPDGPEQDGASDAATPEIEVELRPQRRLRIWQLAPIVALAGVGSLMFAFPLAFGTGDGGAVVAMLGLLISCCAAGWAMMAARRVGYTWPGLSPRASDRRPDWRFVALYVAVTAVLVAAAVLRVARLR